MNARVPFTDRHQAGRRLGELLRRYARRDDVVVLGLARGGVPVAFEVARALDAPLGVFTVRKLGVPGHAELAMGAVGTGGTRVLNPDVIESLHVSLQEVNRVSAAEVAELRRRERAYRDHRPFPDLHAKTVIVVDDGVATGASMLAAIAALRTRSPARLIVAVPVGAESSCAFLAEYADEVVCACTPRPFVGVGAWYEDFTQLGDADVRDLLASAAAAAR